MADPGLDGHPRPPVRRRGEKKVDGTGSQGGQALGRSRGGFGTKIHGAVSGLGLPARLNLSPGQDADITHADGLLDGFAPAVVVADKGHDEQALADAIEATGGEAAIPAWANRTVPRGIDAERYRDRSLDRAVLGETQAVPAGGHRVRGDRPELPGVRPGGADHDLAKTTATICPHSPSQLATLREVV